MRDHPVHSACDISPDHPNIVLPRASYVDGPCCIHDVRFFRRKAIVRGYEQRRCATRRNVSRDLGEIGVVTDENAEGEVIYIKNRKVSARFVDRSINGQMELSIKLYDAALMKD